DSASRSTTSEQRNGSRATMESAAFSSNASPRVLVRFEPAQVADRARARDRPQSRHTRTSIMSLAPDGAPRKRCLPGSTASPAIESQQSSDRQAVQPGWPDSENVFDALAFMMRLSISRARSAQGGLSCGLLRGAPTDPAIRRQALEVVVPLANAHV